MSSRSRSPSRARAGAGGGSPGVLGSIRRYFNPTEEEKRSKMRSKTITKVNKQLNKLENTSFVNLTRDEYEKMNELKKLNRIIRYYPEISTIEEAKEKEEQYIEDTRMTPEQYIESIRRETDRLARLQNQEYMEMMADLINSYAVPKRRINAKRKTTRSQYASKKPKTTKKTTKRKTRSQHAKRVSRKM
jgi:hypothetical protein